MFGIYDMGGNVWEWCEDLYQPGSPDRVGRGASWAGSDRKTLLSSYRDRVQPNIRRYSIGFRCVVGASAR